MFGSYNKFTARVHIDAHIVSLIDFLTSLLASIVITSSVSQWRLLPRVGKAWHL